MKDGTYEHTPLQDSRDKEIEKHRARLTKLEHAHEVALLSMVSKTSDTKAIESQMHSIKFCEDQYHKAIAKRQEIEREYEEQMLRLKQKYDALLEKQDNTIEDHKKTLELSEAKLVTLKSPPKPQKLLNIEADILTTTNKLKKAQDYSRGKEQFKATVERMNGLLSRGMNAKQFKILKRLLLCVERDILSPAVTIDSLRDLVLRFIKSDMDDYTDIDNMINVMLEEEYYEDCEYYKDIQNILSE